MTVINPVFFLAVLTLSAIATSLESPVWNNQSLIWGPFRPNLYFGIRPRIPESVLIGLMWAPVRDGKIIPADLRHTCEQEEAMQGYGWTSYDPRIGGTQTIHDAGNHLDVITEFLRSTDGVDGSSWSARIKGLPRSDATANSEWALVLYIGTEERTSDGVAHVQCGKGNEGEARGLVKCVGTHSSIGTFRLRVQDRMREDKTANSRLQTVLRSASVKPDEIWNAKSIFGEHVAMSDDQTASGNLQFIRVDFRGALDLDLFFSSGSISNPLKSPDITKGLEKAYSSFTSSFHSVFAPKYPFNTAKHRKFSQSLLSNLLGGIGYFYGDSKVDTSHAPEYEETDLRFWEKAEAARSRATPEVAASSELFSLVPSRPFFPRGFLWDDGFHLLIVLDWDIDLAMEILQSWLARMDDDGWIAREQILGPEARSKVPPEFQVQYPHYANPPTLFLVVSAFVDTLAGNRSYSGHRSLYLEEPHSGHDLLLKLYPLLKRHYYWFRRTQSGDLKSYPRPGHSANEAYRWRGRTMQHTLTSGLDDYPRAQPPHPGELHVDAISWVGAMAGVLKKIARFIGEAEDQTMFDRHQRAIKRNIESLHWSDDDQAYCDATVENNRHSLVCHKGYLSLFPFLVGLLTPEHKHLNAVLDLIGSESEIWSAYGIRSLSKKDPLYGKGENYWRNPIWININYLVIERLLELANVSGPNQQKAQTMYSALRRNIVTTVFNSWRDTGFAWEQYNPDSGAGQRTRHFTGWTALLVKIAAMPDIRPRGHHDRLRSSLSSNLDVRALAAGIALVIFVMVFRRPILRVWRSIGWRVT